MEKFLYQYLTEYYHIKTSQIGNYGIYLKTDVNKAPKNGLKLINEVKTVFYSDECEDDLVKEMINQWAEIVCPEVDLSFYWKTNEDIFHDIIGFPVITRIAAQTIGLDLVSVQPMSAPVGKLLYFDYQATNDEKEVYGFLNNIYNKIVAKTIKLYYLCKRIKNEIRHIKNKTW
jgi:hypothetical protein